MNPDTGSTKSHFQIRSYFQFQGAISEFMDSWGGDSWASPSPEGGKGPGWALRTYGKYYLRRRSHP